MATLIDTEGYGDQFVLTESSLTVKVSTTVDGTLSAGNTTINGNLITTGNANIGGTATWAASIVGTTKLFDIPHPTKDDMRLRHGCLEGPELGVYARGKTSEGIIPLPDYWSGLVDEKSITVHLTPTSIDQTLTVGAIQGLTIQVQGAWRMPYYYMVMAERKDVPKLEVEQNA